MDRLAQLNQREFVPTVPEQETNQPAPARFEYKLHSNFNRTTPDDNTYIQQYTVTKDFALVPGDVLYVGAYEKCLELQEALKSGTMTPEQVKGLEQSEKLYLVSDSTYLHIQRSDEGFDYTLYDKETMRLLDGGQLDNPNILLSTACMEICKLHDLDTYTVRLASLDMLETLQEAQKVPAPVVGEDMDSGTDDGAAAAPETMLPDAPEQAMDEPLPDPAVTPQMMESFGYLDSDMLPLSKERAMELTERDITVYMLFSDNTEAMVFDTDDVENHDGLFGIAREDWHNTPEYSDYQQTAKKEASADNIALPNDAVLSSHRPERTMVQAPENHLKAAEMSMEDDYGMIDGIINNGKAADHDRKENKPSVLEQLRNQPVQERTHKTAPKKSAEREI